jgi:hypothetical protein
VLADEKKSISDADIEAVAYSGMAQPGSVVWTLKHVSAKKRFCVLGVISDASATVSGVKLRIAYFTKK